MKIKDIKVNCYGNLKNKDINFGNINIIYGKNESGKSTLLNFIKNTFYGISKNKNGRDISDYDKYYPWDGEGFSGKIKYVLDNTEVFEVYRDFNKKAPQIYNEQMEDISSQFKIDKRLGNQFFIEQTGIDEGTFVSTAFAMQREIKLDSNTQSNLLQKVANLTESGTEDISYKKVLADLNAMLLKEVGTNNSKDRPINIAKSNVDNYTMEIEKISNIKNSRFDIEEKINKLRQDILQKEKELEIANKVKVVIENNKIEEQKIKIKTDILDENNEKIKQLDNEKDSILRKVSNLKSIMEKDDTTTNGTKTVSIVLFILSILINVLSFAFIHNMMVNLVMILLIPIFLVNLIIKTSKENKKAKNSKEQVNKEHTELEKQMEILDGQIDILERNNNDIKEQISELKDKANNYIQEEKKKIIMQYKDLEAHIISLFSSDLDLILNVNKQSIDNAELELHKLELDRNNINPELERLLSFEEALEIEEEILKDLQIKSEEFNLAKELIEEAYIEMKRNVVPKFNQSLSNNIDKISNGKYKNVTVNDNVVVEFEDGRYILADNLSIGTIEQIYLSLRLSVMDELSKEKLPIMLDEVFAYYDDDRLKSALEFLAKSGHQIILFTCTNRERELLDLMNLEYNFIEL